MIKNFLFGFGMTACIFIWVAVVGLGAAFFSQIHHLAGFLFAFIFRKEG